MRFPRVSSFFAVSLLLIASALPAQDTRKVVEPQIPAACITLEAVVVANNGVIADKDERSLDTGRIQNAIDTCTAGKSVVLRAAGMKNVFLTGPLSLRSGVTLVVDVNTALVASRDPRLYDLAPGSCGVFAAPGSSRWPVS